MAVRSCGPVWWCAHHLREGISFWLPVIGNARCWRDPVVRIGWLKWELHIGWRGF